MARARNGVDGGGGGVEREIVPLQRRWPWHSPWRWNLIHSSKCEGRARTDEDRDRGIGTEESMTTAIQLKSEKGEELEYDHDVLDALIEMAYDGCLRSCS